MSSPDRRATNAFEHLIRYPIPKSQTVTSCCSLQKSTGLFANRSRPRERDLQCPIMSGMTSINEFSEF